MPKAIYLGDVCERVTYPGTTFAALQIADYEHTDKCVLQAICTTDDTFKEGAQFSVCRVLIVDSYYETVEEAVKVIRGLVHYLACHEADEKIEVDGVKVFNPHDSAFGATSVFV
jgi:hypothetical protein